MQLAVPALMLAATLLTGAAFGFFYAWSVTVIRGLGVAGGAVAVPAMQAVNAAIMTPWFALLFFGTPIVTGAAGIAAWLAGGREAALWLAAATLLYLAGCFAVTVLANVPMNQALARLDPGALGDADAVWRSYAGTWSAWNHVRTAACAAALACAALGLMRWPG